MREHNQKPASNNKGAIYLVSIKVNTDLLNIDALYLYEVNQTNIKNNY